MPPVTLPDCAAEVERADFARGLATLDDLLVGLLALSPSLDSVGPLARSVADCAAIFRVLAPDAVATPAPALAVPEAGWPDMLNCEAEARAAWLRACDACRQGGIALETVPLPPLSAFHAAGSVVMMAEVARSHAAGVRADFAHHGEVFRSRALPGAALGPVPLATVDKFHFLQDANLNNIANCTGAPALSLPVPRDTARRPFGIQLLGGAGAEAGLRTLGARLEARLDAPAGLPF